MSLPAKLPRLSPYSSLNEDEKIQIHVFVDVDLYRQLRSTCLDHGDAADYLAYFFSLLTILLDKHELTTTYNPATKETVRALVKGIKFTGPDGHPVS